LKDQVMFLVGIQCDGMKYDLYRMIPTEAASVTDGS